MSPQSGKWYQELRKCSEDWKVILKTEFNVFYKISQAQARPRKLISHNFPRLTYCHCRYTLLLILLQIICHRQFMLVWAVNTCTAAVYHFGDIEHLDTASNRSCLQVFKIAINPTSRNCSDLRLNNIIKMFTGMVTENGNIEVLEI